MYTYLLPYRILPYPHITHLHTYETEIVILPGSHSAYIIYCLLAVLSGVANLLIEYLLLRANKGSKYMVVGGKLT